MAHPEQRAFFERVRFMFPWMFKNVRALDCGSLDVNGSLRDLFTGSTYTGVDVVPGKNVDVVSKVHEFSPPSTAKYDTIVSAEMLEHDPHWADSLGRMYELLRPGGLLVISCAGPGRPEHGTRRTTGAGEVWTGPENPDYYLNIGENDIRSRFGLPIDGQETITKAARVFRMFESQQRATWPQDTYFWGIKS